MQKFKQNSEKNGKKWEVKKCDEHKWEKMAKVDNIIERCDCIVQ